MATATLRPFKGTGSDWNNMSNAYDVSGTSTAATVSLSRYASSRYATFDFDLSGFPSNANITEAILTVNAKSGGNSVSLFADINGDSSKRIINSNLTTAQINCTADVTDYIRGFFGSTESEDPSELYSVNLTKRQGYYTGSGQSSITRSYEAVTTSFINLKELLNTYGHVRFTATSRNDDIYIDYINISSSNNGSVEHYKPNPLGVTYEYPNEYSKRTVIMDFKSTNATLMSTIKYSPYVCFEIASQGRISGIPTYIEDITTAKVESVENSGGQGSTNPNIKLTGVLTSGSSSVLSIYDITLNIEYITCETNLGNTSINSIYLGQTGISEVYLGTTLVYKKSSSSSGGSGDSGASCEIFTNNYPWNIGYYDMSMTDLVGTNNNFYSTTPVKWSTISSTTDYFLIDLGTLTGWDFEVQVFSSNGTNMGTMDASTSGYNDRYTIIVSEITDSTCKITSSQINDCYHSSYLSNGYISFVIYKSNGVQTDYDGMRNAKIYRCQGSNSGNSGNSGTTGTSNISMRHNSGVDYDGSFYNATMYARSNKINVSEYSSITISVRMNTIFDYELGYLALYDSSQNCVDVISIEGGTSYTTNLSSNVAYIAFDMFVDDDDDPNITATMKYTYR